MLLEQKTTDFLEQLSSSAPIPGGGGASSAGGAFALTRSYQKIKTVQ